MGKVRVVVTDANIIINLIHVGELPLLGALVEFDFVVPDEVVAEILYPEHAKTLQEALDAVTIARVSIADTEELAVFAMLTTVSFRQGCLDFKLPASKLGEHGTRTTKHSRRID